MGRYSNPSDLGAGLEALMKRLPELEKRDSIDDEVHRPARQKQRRLSTSERTALLRDHSAGMRQTDLAIRYEVHTDTVRSIIRRASQVRKAVHSVSWDTHLLSAGASHSPDTSLPTGQATARPCGLHSRRLGQPQLSHAATTQPRAPGDGTRALRKSVVAQNRGNRPHIAAHDTESVRVRTRVTMKRHHCPEFTAVDSDALSLDLSYREFEVVEVTLGLQNHQIIRRLFTTGSPDEPSSAKRH